jgi:hypothetical protein
MREKAQSKKCPKLDVTKDVRSLKLLSQGMFSGLRKILLFSFKFIFLEKLKTFFKNKHL